MAETITQPKLYNCDFVAWCEDTVVKLKARDIKKLDFDGLIEEIEGLALRDKRELESRLRVLLVHLLKRLMVALFAPRCTRWNFDGKCSFALVKLI